MFVNIREKLTKVKNKIGPYEKDLILVFVIISVALIAFGLGRLSAVFERKIPITVENLTGSVNQLLRSNLDSSERFDLETSDVSEKLYVVSKNGTKYHYPWCSGAQNIKEENKIWFSSKEEAEVAGYTPAANCKGL